MTRGGRALAASRPLPRMVAPALLLALAGCGGIGGAGWDSERDVAEAEGYPPLLAPRLTETVVANDCRTMGDAYLEKYQRAFETIFDDFDYSVQRFGNEPVVLPGTAVEVSFRDELTYVARAGATPLISERLPAVFYMHPPALGVGRLSGMQVLLFDARSRATTGLHFVAIHALDGTPLYRRVLGSGEVRDIRPAGSAIEIVGCGDTRRISIAE